MSMLMNRRQMISGSLAALTCGAVSPAGAFAEPTLGADESSTEPAKRYLAPLFPQDGLRHTLVQPGRWTPSPKLSEREPWLSLPQDVRETVISRAETALNHGWPSLLASSFLEFKQNGNRSEYERLYFQRRQTLADLVLAECVEAKGRFLPAVVDGLWLTCEETFWGLPAHLGMQHAGVGLPDAEEPIIDLFAAETAATLSFASYLLERELDDVSPLIRPRIAREAKRRILDPGLARTDFGWMGLGQPKHKLNNWTPWICSNWLATSLLLEPDRDRQIDSVLKICRSLDLYLGDYSPDGACEEGPGYWSVSAASYLDYLAMLDTATHTSLATTGNSFLRKMVHFIVDAHIAGDYYLNYGDAHPKAVHPAELLHRCGRIGGDPALEAFGSFCAGQQAMQHSDGQGKLMRAVWELFEVPLVRTGRKADALERVAWYPAVGLMATRQTAGSEEGFYLGVQAAPNARSHGHNDSGSFVVFHDGEPVFIDVGVEAYTAATFGPDRYKLWTMQSAYHNLPTVNGVMQAASSGALRATALKFRDEESDTSLAMNLATAYPQEAGIQRWERVLHLQRAQQRVRLEESFVLNRPVPVTLSLMTSRTPSLDGQGGVLLRSPAGKTVRVVFNGADLSARWEPIPLKDPGMRESWGAQIYRILLTSKVNTREGKWTLDFVSDR